MTLKEKLKLIETIYEESPELDLILNKLIEVSIQNVKKKVLEYENILKEFEGKYKLKSKEFYTKFESGEIGDSMDYIEWSGIYELYTKAQSKIQKMEIAA